MFRALKRRARAAPAVARDSAARFARDLATQPPTKGVAAVKAASDVYEANLPSDDRPEGGRAPDAPARDA